MHRVRVTYIAKNQSFFSVIEDITPPRYDGTYEEAQEIVRLILQGNRPAPIQQEGDKWTVFGGDQPAIVIEIVKSDNERPHH